MTRQSASAATQTLCPPLLTILMTIGDDAARPAEPHDPKTTSDPASANPETPSVAESQSSGESAGSDPVISDPVGGDQAKPSASGSDARGGRDATAIPAGATLESDKQSGARQAGSGDQQAGSGDQQAGSGDQQAGSGDQQAGSGDQPQAPASSKLARGGGPLASRGLGVSKPASPAVDPQALSASSDKSGGGKKKPEPGKRKHPRPRVMGDKPDSSSSSESSSAKPEAAKPAGKVQVPNIRQSLPSDIQLELEAELAAADVEAMLSGPAGMPERKEPLVEGGRVHSQVLKIHDDNVFVSLGGPDEGVVPFEQFTEEPAIGSSVEVIVRGMSREDGLYALSLPGGAIDVSDWEDLDEGAVVEAMVTGSNSGGLECKVGGVKGFIPISQISEYRVEDTTEFHDQKLRCVVTEASARRGNLVLSHRAVLEREREEKRKEQLEKIEAGDEIEGVVRSVKDFGAFVDLGGLDGLIHISKLSWDRVKHPSEVLEVGQKVKVKIDTIDKEARKISLSYRDLLENPWDTAEQEFAVGSVQRGTVTRIAAFGCFVRLTAGVEGLVHISELAHHRVSKVDSVVNEGDEVEVKVLSFDRDSQKIGLSIKAAQQGPADAKPKGGQDEALEPPREPAVKATHSGPLKGGNNQDTGGERFGLRW